MKRIVLILIAVGAMVALSALAYHKTTGAEAASAPNRVPVVLELFTSEGCNNCPPAEDVLKKLVDEQPVKGAHVIALAQHVDYWNQNGWADPYSGAAYSERQEEYVKRFQSYSAYTPQLVVDGQSELNGSDESYALQAIAESARVPKATVGLSWTGSGDGKHSRPLHIEVGKLPANSGTVDVLLAITENGLSSDVQSGENIGHKLQHTNVVRRLIVLGEAGANRATAFTGEHAIEIETGWQSNNLTAVVFVQDRETRHILGAAAIPLGG